MKEETWETSEHPTGALVLVWVQAESWREACSFSGRGLMSESRQAGTAPCHPLRGSGKRVGLEDGAGGRRKHVWPTQIGGGDEEKCKMKP